MIEETAVIARIDQNGHEVGHIRLDQSIEWLKPLEGQYAGQEKYIETFTREMLDSLAARGAILATLELQDTYKKTGLSFTLLVDPMFGVEPDVIE